MRILPLTPLPRMHGSDPRTNNLFSLLFSYSPRGDRKPIEDFCTEALAWCLRKSPAFARAVLEKCNVRIGDNALSLVVHTQSSYRSDEAEDGNGERIGIGGGRFDLVIQPLGSQEFVVVIESKVGSPFRKGQLADYKRRINSERAKNPRTIWKLVTLTTRGKSPEPTDADIKWSDVQRLLAACADAISSQHVLETMRQFAEFLKENGLGPLEPMTITPTVLNEWLAFHKLKKEMKQVLKALQEEEEFKTATRREPHWQGEWRILIEGDWGNAGYWGNVGFCVVTLGTTTELVMLVEAFFAGDRRKLRNALPTELKDAYERSKRYLDAYASQLKDDGYRGYANFGSLDCDGNTWFAFTKSVDSELNRSPERILAWLYDTSKAVIKFHNKHTPTPRAGKGK